MPRINKYQLDTSVSSTDKLLGSDENGNTRNFKMEDLSNYFASESGVKKHHQNNSSATWTITHNLDLADYLPQVSLKLSGGGTFNNVQALGVVTYVTKDQLTISFSAPASGYAYLKK
jgi:hypothetical protein